VGGVYTGERFAARENSTKDDLTASGDYASIWTRGIAMLVVNGTFTLISVPVESDSI